MHWCCWCCWCCWCADAADVLMVALLIKCKLVSSPSKWHGLIIWVLHSCTTSSCPSCWIVHGVKLSGIKLFAEQVSVSNCPRCQIIWCQIVCSVKLFTISNCDCDILHTLCLKMLIMSESESVKVNHCISCINWLLSFNEETYVRYGIEYILTQILNLSDSSRTIVVLCICDL